MNNKGNVNAATRKKVEAILDKHDYTPSAIARGMVSKTMKTVAVLTVDIRVPHYARTVYTIEREFSHRGYEVAICNTGGELEETAKYLKTMLEKKVDGIVLVGSIFNTLEQVILNIIDNAIDAIGQNGTVTVTTGRTPNGGASIAISDTGPGLDEETKSKIFDPFFTTKPLGKGTGLGLAICYNILEKLGGRIDVQSEVGKGTTFTIFMPPEPPQQSLMKNSLSDNESHDKA